MQGEGMGRIPTFFALIGLAGLLAACVTAPTGPGPEACVSAGVRVAWDFEGAGQHACLVAPDGTPELLVLPEAVLGGGPINPSPWYAFSVTPLRAGEQRAVTVRLAYGPYQHRYAPWVRVGDAGWQPLEAGSTIRHGAEAKSVSLTLNVPAEGLVIAAQPITTPEQLLVEAAARLEPAGFEAVTYGRSVDGQRLRAWVAGQGPRLIVALTRQHPPEWSGGQAFDAFAAALVADRARLGALLAGHRVLLVPLANPDGLTRGHWRGNARGQDLNRVWGEAADDGPTPEIDALIDLILAEAEGREPVALLDFHSTRRDVVYAPPLTGGGAEMAVACGLRAAHAALDAPVPWTASHTVGGTTAKAWALDVLGVPGLTLEFADDAPLARTQALGRQAAEVVLNTLLRADVDQFSGCGP
jgi:hypothetical protein